MPEAPLDLSRLALERTPSAPAAGGTRRRRNWLTRYLLPLAVLLGFAALLVFAGGHAFWPTQSVTVAPVIVKRGVVQQAGQPLFQAAGWIEPRPTVTNVPALAPGVIEELLVVEGQALEKGDPIARLNPIDAQLAVRQATAAVSNAEGDRHRAIAERQAAQVRLERPIHLQVQLAEAKSQLAKVETERANLPFQIETAKANLAFAQASVSGKTEAGNAVPGVVLQRAKSELAAADAQLRELESREPSLAREIAALSEKVDAIEAQLELLVEERRQLQEAEAKVQSATALLEAAKLELEIAELQLERHTIRAPITGRIFRLLAAPGKRVYELAAGDGRHSSAVVEMYEPGKLQVRADVRLEDVPLVEAGQPVEIETPSSSQPIQGRVLQPNSSANIQKNTLEVKVELIAPPPAVRPDMLVTATFLAAGNSNETQPDQRERVFVPTRLLQSDDRGDFIWIVDADRRAQQARVTRAATTSAELVEIQSGLRITDKLITSDPAVLVPGSRVTITSEDTSLGK